MLRRVLTVALAAGLIAPATASAAKPAVTTGPPASITPSTVTLNGTVDPNRKETTYYFQLGATRVQLTNTATASAGAGPDRVRIAVPVAGLAPATTYHYRLVAQNADGITTGKFRTFKTQRQPLGVNLAASATRVAPGAPVQLAGQLTGTNNAGRQVVVLANPFPYTQGFQPIGNPIVTDASGNFSFPVLSVPVTTQYIVQMPARPDVTSPIVVVGAAVQVKTDTKKVDRHRRSVSVRFSGTVTPATDGARVDIQKLRNGTWTTIAHTRSRHDTSARSEFRTRVRIHRSGQFRVVAYPSQGQYVEGIGRTIRITVRR